MVNANRLLVAATLQGYASGATHVRPLRNPSTATSRLVHAVVSLGQGSLSQRGIGSVLAWGSLLVSLEACASGPR